MDTTDNTTKKKGGFVKWAVVLGIVVVLNLFFNYSLSLVYKSPEYEKYVPQSQVVEPITNKEDCLKVGGQWTDPDTRYAQGVDGVKTAPALGYCNPDFTNYQKFTEAQKDYNRNVFIILIISGIGSIILGAVLSNIILSLGFSWGGVLSLIIASLRYWSDADNLVKVLLLACALGALIWIAVKKFSN